MADRGNQRSAGSNLASWTLYMCLYKCTLLSHCIEVRGDIFLILLIQLHCQSTRQPSPPCAVPPLWSHFRYCDISTLHFLTLKGYNATSWFGVCFDIVWQPVCAVGCGQDYLKIIRNTHVREDGAAENKQPWPHSQYDEDTGCWAKKALWWLTTMSQWPIAHWK